MNTIKLQLSRLQRHYDVAVKTYDRISFLDLSHTLRICTELKQPLLEEAPNFSKAMYFKTSAPRRKILRLIKNDYHVLSYFPGGVVTYANRGKLFAVKEKKTDRRITAGGGTFRIEKSHTVLSNFYYFELDNELSPKVNLDSTPIKRCNFVNWLGAEAVRISNIKSDKSLEKITISREVLIKRIANTYDASHHSSDDDGNYDNKFDAPVKLLFDYTLGGLPLPYFILLKIAQDLLDVTSRHLD